MWTHATGTQCSTLIGRSTSSIPEMRTPQSILVPIKVSGIEGLHCIHIDVALFLIPLNTNAEVKAGLYVHNRCVWCR